MFGVKLTYCMGTMRWGRRSHDYIQWHRDNSIMGEMVQTHSITLVSTSSRVTFFSSECTTPPLIERYTNTKQIDLWKGNKRWLMVLDHEEISLCVLKMPSTIPSYCNNKKEKGTPRHARKFISGALNGLYWHHLLSIFLTKGAAD